VTSETDGSSTTNGPASYAERRAAMADETRTRILEACVEILGRGVAELSIPAVAKEAKVSVPTVYRNFPDKKTLVHETALYLRKLRLPVEPPESLDELPATIHRNYAYSTTLKESVRAALASEVIQEAKRELGETSQRRGKTERLLGNSIDKVPRSERDHAISMITVLCSSATLRAFREVTGATPDEAAETVIWTISRILDRPWQTKRGKKGNR
jgi:AcrR family transcriptional regulator